MSSGDARKESALRAFAIPGPPTTWSLLAPSSPTAQEQPATDRQNALINTRTDAADTEAYANSFSGVPAHSLPQFPTSSSNPADAVGDSIRDDLYKMDLAGALPQ